MPFHQSIGARRYAFADLRTLLARASPARSGDALAGVAAEGEEERSRGSSPSRSCRPRATR